jgi:hypothetical protein
MAAFAVAMLASACSNMSPASNLQDPSVASCTVQVPGHQAEGTILGKAVPAGTATVNPGYSCGDPSKATPGN